MANKLNRVLAGRKALPQGQALVALYPNMIRGDRDAYLYAGGGRFKNLTVTGTVMRQILTDYKQQIFESAYGYNLDPRLIATFIALESSGQKWVVSGGKGATKSQSNSSTENDQSVKNWLAAVESCSASNCSTLGLMQFRYDYFNTNLLVTNQIAKTIGVSQVLIDVFARNGVTLTLDNGVAKAFKTVGDRKVPYSLTKRFCLKADVNIVIGATYLAKLTAGYKEGSKIENRHVVDDVIRVERLIPAYNGGNKLFGSLVGNLTSAGYASLTTETVVENTRPRRVSGEVKGVGETWRYIMGFFADGAIYNWFGIEYFGSYSSKATTSDQVFISDWMEEYDAYVRRRDA